MSILVLDMGTSGVRAAIVDEHAHIVDDLYAEMLPDTPADGLVEFDARQLAEQTISLARQLLGTHPEVTAIGVSSQRASGIVWDRATGDPVGPALGWQDLRTIGECLVAQGDGLRLAPNHTATKVSHIWDQVDPDRTRDLCVGTPDAWLVWSLTHGEVHATDRTNASVSGMLGTDGADWDDAVLNAMRIPRSAMPRLIASSAELGIAHALPGELPICGVAGDQQASLVGQGCTAPGIAKITFGTGGMLDMAVGPERPHADVVAPGGTVPIVAWERDDLMWGLEGIMLSSGTNVAWLRDELGIIDDVAASEMLARQCDSTEGVTYVPAQIGIGTPHWDYGARGALLGLTRGSGRPQIARAVLEGIAHRGVDLIEAVEVDSGVTVETIRVDGGMSGNRLFTQTLADLSGRTVEVSPVKDATSVGAALLAGLETGMWGNWSDIAATWSPTAIHEPQRTDERDDARAVWARAVERSLAWHGDLTAIQF